MKRRAFNVLAGLSLLLCIAVCVLWARDWEAERSDGNAGGWSASFTYRRVARPGVSVAVVLEDLEGIGTTTSVVERVADDGTIGLPYLGRLSVDGLQGRQIASAVQDAYHVTQPIVPGQWVHATVAGGDWRVPYFVPAAAFALPPALALVRAVRLSPRHVPGLCPECGYDLRASPNRCPECGTPIERKGAAV